MRRLQINGELLNMKKLLLLFLAVPLAAQQLPQRDPVTVDTLKIQIADCSINASTEAKYVAKLEAQIRDLQKQLAEAKAAKPVETKTK